MRLWSAERNVHHRKRWMWKRVLHIVISKVTEIPHIFKCCKRVHLKRYEAVAQSCVDEQNLDSRLYENFIPPDFKDENQRLKVMTAFACINSARSYLSVSTESGISVPVRSVRRGGGYIRPFKATSERRDCETKHGSHMKGI